jgi:hypothetical protein
MDVIVGELVWWVTVALDYTLACRASEPEIAGRIFAQHCQRRYLQGRMMMQVPLSQEHPQGVAGSYQYEVAPPEFVEWADFPHDEFHHGRKKVEGGWLYRDGPALAFVPVQFAAGCAVVEAVPDIQRATNLPTQLLSPNRRGN